MEKPRREHLASLVTDLRGREDEIAVVTRHGVRRLATSYGQVAELAARFAACLEMNGIGKGERVVIWGENSAEWLAVFFGCLLRGVVAVPLDAAGTRAFAARVIDDVRPRLVVSDAETIGEVRWLAFESVKDESPTDAAWEPVADLKEADPLQIIFTSGTTGEPKGIVHTHGNILASLRPIEGEIGKYLKYERWFHPLGFLHTLPLSHVFGQFMGIWIPVLIGAVVHFETRAPARELMEYIGQERISVLAAVPRVLELLAAQLLARPGFAERVKSAKGLPVWRRYWKFLDVHRELGFRFWALVCGGATLPREIEEFWGTMGFVVVQGYGMTETAALVSVNHPFRAARGSIGQVLPGREIRLGPDGEILVRGATVARATWEKGGFTERESEWLPTGDLGSLDAAGNLIFKGRKKDVIVTAAGMNIYPEDLEAALQKQPGVRAAAVVEFEGANGPQPLAALVMQDGDAAEAVRAANETLAEYQQVRKWVLWPDPDFSRTTTGKVLRRQVAAAVRTEGQKDTSAVPALIQRITGADAARMPDSARLSEDLGVDSLGRVELAAAIETQFGITPGDEEIQKLKTLGDLRALLASPAGRTLTVTDAEASHRYPEWTWSPFWQSVRTCFLEIAAFPLTRLLAAPRIENRGLAAPDRPVLLVANHQTEFDVPLLLCALPGSMRRHVAVAMAGEMLRDFRLGRGQGSAWRNFVVRIQYWLITALFNVFPLPQLGSFRASFAHAGRAMDHGYHVLVFPEGRRSPDREMHAFQAGAGILWKELGCDAAPMYLEGLGELKQAGKGWFRSGRIIVRVGSPIRLPENIDAAEAAKILERGVRALATAGR